MTDVEDLYETDFVAWTQAQAKELRRMRRERVNTALDLARLAEEIEDLGSERRFAVRSFVRVIIEHLLKLDYSTQRRPSGKWAASVQAARAQARDRITPQLRKDLATKLPDLFTPAREAADRSFDFYGDHAAGMSLPDACPYTVDQILDPDWWPEGVEPRGKQRP